MVRLFLLGFVRPWLWLVVVFGLSLNARAELSAEAAQFKVRLNLSDSVEEFQVLENWVFEKGLDLENRLTRVNEVENILSDSSYQSKHRLRLEGLADRLGREFPEEWQVWVVRAEIQRRLPARGIFRDEEFERQVSWSDASHSVADRDRIVSLGYLMHADALALKGHQAGKVSGDDLAGLYLKLGDSIRSLRGDNTRILTDLKVLPEPTSGRSMEDERGPIMDAEGKLQLPQLHESFEEARTDLERSYWYYHRAGLVAEKMKAEVRWKIALFWHDLLSVENVAYQGYLYIEGTESEFDMAAPGEFELHTLEEDETFVVGPEGPKRVILPPHCRYISLLRELIADQSTPEEIRWGAAQDLVQMIYPNRKQFNEALNLARKMGTRSITRDGKSSEEGIELRSLKPDAALDGGGAIAHGSPPMITLSSRGLDEVELELWRIKKDLPWEAINFENLDQISRYSGPTWLENKDWDGDDIREEHKWFEENCEHLKSWKVAIRQKPNQMQSSTKVRVPVEKPGNYIVVRRVEKGRELLPLQIYDVAVVSGGFIEQEEVEDGPIYYAIDPATGDPLEGVELRQVQGGFDDNLYTVSDHTGHLPALSGRGLALVRRPGSEWQLMRWDSEYPERELWTEDEIQSFLVTNQPLYRPGQKVSLAGWLRYAPEWMGHERTLPDRLPVRLTVNDPTGREVWSSETRLDDFDGFSGEFQLGDEIVLGDYRIEIQQGASTLDPFANNEDGPFKWKSLGSHGRWSFEVGEFRKPDFQVNLKPVMGGDGFEAIIEATYLSGEPVKHAVVTAGLQGLPLIKCFQPGRQWDDLYSSGYQWGLPLPIQFHDWEKWAMWAEYQWSLDEFPDYNGYDHQVIARAEAVTDEQGQARVKFDAEFPFLDRFAYDITLKAGVTEFTGRTVGASETLIHTGRPFEVFARPLKGFYRTGEKVEIEVGMLSTEREPRSGVGSLKVERIVNGNDQPVFEREIQVGKSGEETVSFQAPEAGQYRCLFNGGGGERGFVMEVLGEGGTRGSYGGVQVIPREFMVQSEEAVEVLIRTDEASVTVWLFELLPNGMPRTPRIVTTQNHTAVLKIPVLRAAQPNFILEALTFWKGTPRRNRCMILVPDIESRLELAMTLDQESGKPGGKAAVEVSVRDHLGHPKEAALAVTVFDRALEDLSSPLPSTSRLRDLFVPYGTVSTSLDEEDSWYQSFGGVDEPGIFSERYDISGNVLRTKASRFVKIGGELWQNYSPPELPNQVGGNIGGGAGFPVTPATPAFVPRMAGAAELNDQEFGLVDRAKVRQKFADKAYWGAALLSGKDGKLTIDFELPENLTSWRVQSWAFGRGRSFGDAKVELPVSKELQVRPLLPRAAVVGDELVIGAMIQNRSTIDDTFALSLKVEGASIIDGHTKKITLKSGEEGLAQWRVKMENSAGVVFQVKAAGQTSKLTDGFEYRVPTADREVVKTVSDRKIVQRDERASKLKLPFEPTMKGHRMNLRVEAHPAVSALKILPDLVEYPYGCVEQTLNRFLPLLIARNASDQLGLDWEKMSRLSISRNDSMGWIRGRSQLELSHQEVDLSETKVRDMVHVGTNRLKEMQKDDGSWGWFSNDDPTDRAYLTALAIRGLTIAGPSRDPAKTPDPILRGVNWLESWSRHTIERNPGERRLAEAAFVAWVLREAGSDEAEKLVDQLWEIRDALSSTSRIHLALAMKNAERLDILAKEIRKTMETPQLDKGSYYSWWNEPIERRATYLKLLVKLNASPEELDQEIFTLLGARKDGIRWKSTRESALCLEAILNAGTVIGFDPFEIDSTVEVKIHAMGQDHTLFLSEDTLWSESLDLPIDEDLPEGENEIIVEVVTQGEIAIFLNGSVTFPSSDPKTMLSETTGLDLKRHYYRITSDGNRELLKDGEVLKVGEMIEVELLIDAGQPREFLHLRDPIPAGLEPLMQLSGYDHGAYRESRTGESHFFITELSPWSRRHRYILSVVTEGVSLALPSQVECMYSPEIRGRSSARQMTIKR